MSQNSEGLENNIHPNAFREHIGKQTNKMVELDRIIAEKNSKLNKLLRELHEKTSDNVGDINLFIIRTYIKIKEISDVK